MIYHNSMTQKQVESVRNLVHSDKSFDKFGKLQHLHTPIMISSFTLQQALASKPTSSRKCPVLGSRIALFFDCLKPKITKQKIT